MPAKGFSLTTRRIKLVIRHPSRKAIEDANEAAPSKARTKDRQEITILGKKERKKRERRTTNHRLSSSSRDRIDIKAHRSTSTQRPGSCAKNIVLKISREWVRQAIEAVRTKKKQKEQQSTTGGPRRLRRYV